MRPAFIIITGHPGTGKTTLAHRLGEALRLPVFSKDEIKEILFDQLGWTDVTWSRKLSIAAYRVMDYAIAEALATGDGIIVESNFLAEFDSERVQNFVDQFDTNALQILLFCDESVRSKRFHDRVSQGERHPGHHDLDQFQKNLRTARCVPLTIKAPIIEIDTTDFEKVDFDGLVDKIRRAMK